MEQALPWIVNISLVLLAFPVSVALVGTGTALLYWWTHRDAPAPLHEENFR